MMRRLALGVFLLFFCATAHAAPHFPVLTGHVVDDANVLSRDAAQELDQKLMEYERGTSNQVIVVTLSSLQGLTIEDYGYQLGRYWGIGQKGKNNGTLFIVAPNERKVRIEVGYGLEGVLTDATSSQIIQGIVLPNFKSGDMERGVVDGAQAILEVLGGHGVVVSSSDNHASTVQSVLGLIMLILFLSFAARHPFIAMMLLSDSRFGGSSSGGSSWGGGGGGSFGGGGASGSW